MACNRCGHTKSSPCACQDHGLTTPCSYTNCDTSACEEIICSECVVDCNTSQNRPAGAVTWNAERSAGATSTSGIAVKQGASNIELLQRLSLAATDPGGADAMSIAIAPFTASNVTSSSVQLNWANVPTNVSSVSIYRAPAASSTWTLDNTINSKVSSTLTQTITGLTSKTEYKFKLISTAPGGEGRLDITANSVALYITTK
tara:strand:+ start:90 stop:695 length:606 start_codon:yes stop_codon:yes gene_type:complete